MQVGQGRAGEGRGGQEVDPVQVGQGRAGRWWTPYRQGENKGRARVGRRWTPSM